MSRDGTGTYTPPATMATANAIASSVTVNSIINDIAQALTDSINKDGTKAFAASQSMGGNRLTSLGAGTALTDAAQVSQVQKGTLARATTVGGTVDAITLNFTPAITSYTTGMVVRWVSGGTNTVTAPTINIDGLGAKTLKKNPASAALAVGDLGASGSIVTAEYNGTDFIVLNPVQQATGTGASPVFAGMLVNSATGLLGYSGASGQTVSQSTNKNTAVTSNTPCGRINLAAGSIAGGDTATFTVNCSLVDGSQIVVLYVQNGSYSARVYGATGGVFQIILKNETAGALNDTFFIGYALIDYNF